VHDESIYLFSCGVVVGQREQRCLPSCHAPGMQHHQEHGTTPSLCNTVDSPFYSPEIRFSSAVQPQEAGTAVTFRNVVNHNIPELTRWGNKPFSGGLHWLPA